MSLVFMRFDTRNTARRATAARRNTNRMGAQKIRRWLRRAGCSGGREPLWLLHELPHSAHLRSRAIVRVGSRCRRLPLYEMIKAHVFAAERIHGDDTTVPVLAKVKTSIGRIWTHVRDDRPFGGADPPAAVFFYSPDRAGTRSEQHLACYSGILQADAYAGFNALYAADRKEGPITQAGCWAHARRKLFELADIASQARKERPTTISPIAFEAVQKMDAIFALERSINGLSAEARGAARRKDIAPPVHELIDWMKRERASSPATTRWRRPWTTCSSASTSSRASSTTAAFA
jgi:hypothetical protein